MSENTAPRVPMEQIMSSTIGEASSTIRASYKKTVLIRQYETEVIELDTTLTIDKEVSNAERILISALLQAQLEYSAYINLANKGLVTQSELDKRKKELEESVALILLKAESTLGKSLRHYLGMNMG